MANTCCSDTTATVSSLYIRLDICRTDAKGILIQAALFLFGLGFGIVLAPCYLRAKTYCECRINLLMAHFKAILVLIVSILAS